MQTEQGKTNKQHKPKPTERERKNQMVKTSTIKIYSRKDIYKNYVKKITRQLAISMTNNILPNLNL